MGCHFRLHRIFPTQGLNPRLSIFYSGRQILYHCATWEAPLFYRLGNPIIKSFSYLLKIYSLSNHYVLGIRLEVPKCELNALKNSRIFSGIDFTFMKYQICEVAVKILSDRKVSDNFLQWFYNIPVHFLLFWVLSILLAGPSLSSGELPYPSFSVLVLIWSSVVGLWFSSGLSEDCVSLASRTGLAMIM